MKSIVFTMIIFMSVTAYGEKIGQIVVLAKIVSVDKHPASKPSTFHAQDGKH